jgi:hypothetical protein
MQRCENAKVESLVWYFLFVLGMAASEAALLAGNFLAEHSILVSCRTATNGAAFHRAPFFTFITMILVVVVFVIAVSGGSFSAVVGYESAANA